MKILFFDTETTGTPKNYRAPLTDFNNWPRLVELAFIQTDENGTELHRGTCIVKPDGFTIPDEAAKIHGISTEKATAEGYELRAVMLRFGVICVESDLIAGHNIGFDLSICGCEFLRCGLLNPLAGKNSICTMQKSTNLLQLPGPYGFKWPKLQELYKHLFGCEFDKAHSAAADIEATAKCYFELVKRGII